MNAPAQSLYLDSYLAPLQPWLLRADVTDIYVNRPGEIWVEALEGTIERHSLPQLTGQALLRLARQIAALSAQGINREAPLLSASLPDGSRVQLVLPPATRGDVALAVRRHVSRDISLEAWRGAACWPLTAEGQSVGRPELEQSLMSGEPIDMLIEAVKQRRNVLISGGTSSGKTTLLNGLLREIPASERLILIEDAPELHLQHDNAVGLIAARGQMGEADVSADDLLIAALRMRPDRIILGEIRGREATTFLRAINTGHPGSLSTIHADSPQGAIDQLALLVLQSGSRLNWDDVVRYIRRSIDVIVQLSRADGSRAIEAISWLSRGKAAPAS